MKANTAISGVAIPTQADEWTGSNKVVVRGWDGALSPVSQGRLAGQRALASRAAINPLPCFSRDISGHVARLVPRPEATNTMNPAFWRELGAVLAQLHASNDARVLVISSTGKHFNAGMVLETFAGGIAVEDQSPEIRAAIFVPLPLKLIR